MQPLPPSVHKRLEYNNTVGIFAVSCPCGSWCRVPAPQVPLPDCQQQMLRSCLRFPSVGSAISCRSTRGAALHSFPPRLLLQRREQHAGVCEAAGVLSELDYFSTYPTCINRGVWLWRCVNSLSLTEGFKLEISC